MSGHWNRTLPCGLAVLAAIGLACSGTKEVKLTAVTVSPATSSIAKGTSRSFVATAVFSNNTKRDVTAVATWTASNPAVLAIQSAGLAKGVGIGTGAVTATYQGATATASLSVTAAELLSLSVTPFEVTVPKGVSADFRAAARFTDDTVQDVTHDVDWSSSAPSVAAFAGNGRANTLAEGEATITATLSGRQASTRVIVTAAQLVSLDLQPANPSLPKGLNLQMRAMGSFTDNTSQDLTQSVVWCTIDQVGQDVAEISNEPTTRGLVHARNVGQSEICASYCNTFTAHTMLTVTPAVLTSLTITPTEASAPKGLGAQFHASGVYSDGTPRDLTGDVVWASSNEAIATISNDAGSAGLATGHAIGNATITASAPESEIQATAAMHVTAAIVMKVDVTPAQDSIPKGLDRQFTATVTLSDGNTPDVTAVALWSSSDEGIAPVSNAEGSAGKAHGLAVGGPVQITAAYGGRSGAGSLTVTDAVMKRLEIAPASGATIPKGLDQQFTAQAIYTDEHVQAVTADAAWTSSDANVATFSAPGLAHGAGVGSAVIRAVHGGFFAEAPLQVTEAQLVAIGVEPVGSSSIPKGLDRAFKATGAYTDGIPHDITTLVSWTSSDEAVATVSNAQGFQGIAHGEGVGIATITARMGEITGSADLQVTREELTQINVTPPSPIVPKGLRQQFTATGVYTDKSEQDLTATVAWSSDPASGIVALHNEMGSEGIAETLAVGKATVIATYPGTLMTGTALIEVTAATVKRVEIVPVDHHMAKGLHYLFYKAYGIYTDDERIERPDVTWASSDPDVAPISNDAATKGDAFGNAVGTVVVTASLPDSPITASTTLSITPAELRSVEVHPDSATRAAGYTAEFSATATYTDGPVTITDQAAWTSSDYEIASVEKGVAKARKASDLPVTITATFGGLSDTASFTVTPAELVRIDVQPETQSTPKGLIAKFQAIGTFSDGSTLDITVPCGWGVEPGAGAALAGAGTFLAQEMGSYTVSAQDARTGLSDTATLTVTEEELVWVELTPPADLSIPKGMKAQFGATGWFTDGSPRPYTGLVTWLAEPEAVASFNCDGCAKGEVKGLAVGSAMISAVDPASGLAAHVGAPDGATQVELVVTPAELVSIAVTPLYARLPAGLHQLYIATGTFTDGDERDLTAAVIWSPSNPDVAVISNAHGYHGDAITRAVGSTTIRATFPVLGIYGEATLDVSDALLDYLFFDAATPARLPEGMSFPISVKGMYTDGEHLLDGDPQLMLSSSSDLLTISGQVATAGDCPTDACPVTITATFPGHDGNPVQVQQVVTIVPEVMKAIWFEPSDPGPIEGTSTAFRIWGRKTLNPSAVAIRSDDPLLELSCGAGVSLSPSGDGTYLFVSRLAYGPSTVTATYTGPTETGQALVANVGVLFTVAPVSLGAAGNYAILAETGISSDPTNAADNHVTGNLGTSSYAATSITGFALTMDSSNEFSTSDQVTGKVYAADYAGATPADLTAAVLAMGAAYTEAAGRAPGATELNAGDIGGMNLPPGVYRWSTGLLIPTDVTLTGSATDVWIFQVAGTMTMSSGANVILAGGASPGNIIWQVADYVDLGTTSHCAGTILTQSYIAMNTGASIDGRLMAHTAVTLIGNKVAEPAP